MRPSLSALMLVSVASVAYTEDVTLFEVPWPSETFSPLNSVSVVGISPLSVDEAGVTPLRLLSSCFVVSFYECRVVHSDSPTPPDLFRRKLGPCRGDLLREHKYECVYHENGTAVCQNRVLEKGAGTTVTAIDLTYSGTPTPWATVKNVEAALPTADDKGGADRSWVVSSLVGAIAFSLGLGSAVVLL
ncbi:hypothetical protein BKA70DRAFT_54659 [Coprinopsis sp. MPI-PUGE-AT-0042]|nr:hypothetical protein BKA70DRAFT_54659 [Coprinopsis sp. MPI-PUGE-AT-0042]